MGYKISELNQIPIEGSVRLYAFIIYGGRECKYAIEIKNNFDVIAEQLGNAGVIVGGLGSTDIMESRLIDIYFGENYRIQQLLLPALIITDSHPERVREDSLKLLVPLESVEEQYGSLNEMFKYFMEFCKKPEESTFLDKFVNLDRIEDLNEVFQLNLNIFGVGINLNAFITKLVNEARERKKIEKLLL